MFWKNLISVLEVALTVDNILWYMFFGTVLLLILSLEFIFAYFYSKNKLWIKCQLFVTIPAVVLSLIGLVVSTVF